MNERTSCRMRVCATALPRDQHGDIHITLYKDRCIVRTNIELDAELIRQAMELSRIKTKRAVVHQALEEFVANRKRRDLRELRRAALIDPDYDHKAARIAR